VGRAGLGLGGEGGRAREMDPKEERRQAQADEGGGLAAEALLYCTDPVPAPPEQTPSSTERTWIPAVLGLDTLYTISRP
jgi:hypothetical protein